MAARYLMKEGGTDGQNEIQSVWNLISQGKCSTRISIAKSIRRDSGNEK